MCIHTNKKGRLCTSGINAATLNLPACASLQIPRWPGGMPAESSPTRKVWGCLRGVGQQLRPLSRLWRCKHLSSANDLNHRRSWRSSDRCQFPRRERQGCIDTVAVDYHWRRKDRRTGASRVIGAIQVEGNRPCRRTAACATIAQRRAVADRRSKCHARLRLTDCFLIG